MYIYSDCTYTLHPLTLYFQYSFILISISYYYVFNFFICSDCTYSLLFNSILYSLHPLTLSCYSSIGSRSFAYDIPITTGAGSLSPNYVYAPHGQSPDSSGDRAWAFNLGVQGSSPCSGVLFLQSPNFIYCPFRVPRAIARFFLLLRLRAHVRLHCTLAFH